MRSVTTATIRSLNTATRPAQERRSGRIVGLAVASLAPALFWMVMIEMVAYWLGRPLSPTTLTMVGATIAFFLFAVCAPLMLRTDADR
jgi:hypothetical protein